MLPWSYEWWKHQHLILDIKVLRPCIMCTMPGWKMYIQSCTSMEKINILVWNTSFFCSYICLAIFIVMHYITYVICRWGTLQKPVKTLPQGFSQRDLIRLCFFRCVSRAWQVGFKHWNLYQRYTTTSPSAFIHLCNQAIRVQRYRPTVMQPWKMS